MITEAEVLEALKGVEDPELHRSVVELNMVRNIQVSGNHISVEVILTIAGCPLKAKIQGDITEALKALGAEEVSIRFGSMTPEEREELAAQLRGGQKGRNAVPGSTKSISPLLEKDSKTTFIAIASGKGGVGKSTVTSNLAVSLARMDKKVGIIDADIYGFSIPKMMGNERRPTVIDNVILPVEENGVKVMSMGFFNEDNQPVVWRGPMLGKMLRNFFSEVHWGELDYMLLDLPPGTGDVALDIHSLIPQCKEVIVTTPHATASYIATRAGAMALQTHHEIIGVVENMAYFSCGDCGDKNYIFGKGGGERLASELKTELLAQIPLGQPEGSSSSSIYQPETPIGAIYKNLAEKVVESSFVPV